MTPRTSTDPATEMSTAARTLRRLATAEGLPDGPWEADAAGWPQTVAAVGADEILAEVYDASGLDNHDAPHVTAPYMAAMHPVVGRALADWLDDASHSYASAAIAAAQVLGDDPQAAEAFLTTGPGAQTHALVVARAINQQQEATT